MVDKSLININNQADILKTLANSHTKYQQAIISKADKNLVLAICDIIYNILYGNVKIDSETKNKLQKHKLFIRRVIKKSSLKKKKKILQQKGGNILSIVLPTLISAIASLFIK